MAPDGPAPRPTVPGECMAPDGPTHRATQRHGPERPRPPAPDPPGLGARSGVGAAEAVAVVDLLEDEEEVVDLLGGVGGGQLDAEAGLLAGDRRVGGEGDVDAAVEQVAAD